MKEIKFSPYKDKFGFQSFKSFLDHVDYYQYAQYVQYGTIPINFNFLDEGIPIYDIFEFYQNINMQFKDLNVIVVETLRQFLSIQDKLDISKKYIVLSESFWEKEKHTTSIDYNLIYIPWDLIDAQNNLASRSNLYFHLIDLTFFQKYLPKFNFLCLIGRAKPWRDNFVDKLKSKVKLDNTLTSYYGRCLGSTALLDIDIPYERNNSKLEFENKFYNPINIPGTMYSYNLSYFTKNELFYNTKFSVVVETEAELEEYHVTEKTIRCLILGHPLVVISSPGYLKFLQEQGFTTYDSIFDESYDKITNLDDRMDAVIKLIVDLQEFDFDINKLIQIREKNLNNLIKLRHKSTYEKFLGLFDV